MTARADALRSEVLALPEAARARLVIELLDSLDDRPVEADPAELDRVWADETARRARQIDTGEVTTDSWDDVVAKVGQARPGLEVLAVHHERRHPLYWAERAE